MVKIAIAYRHDNPRKKELPYKEAIKSYLDLADEVYAIKVNDSEFSLKSLPGKIKVVEPTAFGGDWRRAGYFQDADWVFLVEPYQIFSDRNIAQTRRRLEKLSQFKVVSFNSFRFILASRAIRESIPIAFNRALGLDWDKLLRLTSTEIANIGLFLYSYELTFRTKRPDVFGLSQFGDLARADFAKCDFALQPNVHPSYIRDRLARLSEQNFGFGGWGLLR